MKHSNAIAGGFAGALAIVALYLGTLADFDPPSYVAGAITTLVIGTVLFIGKSGFRGVVRLLWRGNE